MSQLPSDLKDLKVPELQESAVSRGIKQHGVAWETCCPSKGLKNDIIVAIQRSADQASRHTSVTGVSQRIQLDWQVVLMLLGVTCVLSLAVGIATGCADSCGACYFLHRSSPVHIPTDKLLEA